MEWEMQCDFDDITITYLLHPLPQIANSPAREQLSARLASLALGRPVSADDIAQRIAEESRTLPALDTIPLPDDGYPAERSDGAAQQTQLLLRHPMSASERNLEIDAFSVADMEALLREVISGADDPRRRFLRIWRYLPDRLSELQGGCASTPADVRFPDRSLWHDRHVAAGWRAAARSSDRVALAVVALGPVQGFIAAARSVRDLWTGSYILSWLTFHAMLPILRTYGPTAFVYPALRGLPAVDRWLFQEGVVPEERGQPTAESLRVACLPNRFLALIPYGENGSAAQTEMERCQSACRSAWGKLSHTVKTFLDEKLHPLSSEWSALWDEQVNSFFDLRTTVLPLDECNDRAIAQLLSDGSDFASALPAAAAVREMSGAVHPSRRGTSHTSLAGRWSGQVEISARSMAASKNVCHLPMYRPRGRVPQKCSILGTYEQTGPAEARKSGVFWDAASRIRFAGGVRVRTGERLCAVSLVKRFAWPALLASELGSSFAEGSFPDTATIAAQTWLREAGISPTQIRRQHGHWNGQWLHWVCPDQDADEQPVASDLWRTIQEQRKKLGSPPAYYAILHMDGDEMGLWLSGHRGPKVGECIHPQVREVLEKLADERISRAMDALRPMNPALHVALSEALSNFASHFVPEIVKQHEGSLVYAGGDDVLALLPTACAIDCADNLRQTFSSDWRQAADGREYLLMGRKATVSAGIAVVHHKEDLRLALDAARHAERAAKDGGRDAVTLSIWPRSGVHVQVAFAWRFADYVRAWTDLFRKGASDRWAYKARQELPVLSGLPPDAIASELSRLASRSEASHRYRIDPEQVPRAFMEFREDRRQRDRLRPPYRVHPQCGSEGKILADYISLIQAASFIARGRD